MRCPGYFPKLTKELHTLPLSDLILLVSTTAACIFKSLLAVPLLTIFAGSLFTRIILKVILPGLGYDIVNELTLALPTGRIAYYLSVGAIAVPLLLSAVIYKIAIIIAIAVGICRGIIDLSDPNRYQQILDKIKRQTSETKKF